MRANALEDNVRLYTVIDGHRTQLTSADLPVPPQTWHPLRVVCLGDRIDVHVDGRRVIAAQNTAISNAGHVGLWTKADSVTLFDDLQAWTVR